MTSRRKDAHYRRARAAGYRARSAWKLVELDARFGLLRAGEAVVDLGAWPGGWLQVARERVGEGGAVVGLDLAPIEPLGAANVSVLTGDVRDPAAIRNVASRLGRAADLVLSDLSPKLTGIRDTDDARSAELVDAVIAGLPTLLRPGGRLLIKVFMGPDHARTLGRLRQLFTDVRSTRPDATRRGSAELYVVGRDYCIGKA